MKILTMKKSTVLLPATFLIFGSCQDHQVRESVPSKPNILFIYVDDLGYFDLSCMGSNYYETPNTDRIAHEGMIFTNGYSNAQVSSPSRASIMTGKFPARHGITDWIGAHTGEDWRRMGRNNKLLPADYVRNLPHEYITLPEALKEAGYKNFFAGKWHLGSEGSWPEDHGFDINIGGWDTGWPRGGYFSPWRNPNLPSGPDGENLTMRLARETADFIRTHKDTTFFAFLSFYAVHSPLETTREKWAKYRQKAEDMGYPEQGFEMGHFLPIRQVQDNPLYAGLVEIMDDAIGLVLDALEEMDLDENTIVIFTSDNGGVASGDAFATSNLPLRAGKGYQFEGGIRVPFFIKVPWLDIKGTTSDVPVTGADLYPTLLELAGIESKPDEHKDGVSLVPVINGRTISERPLIWHYPHYGNQGGEPSSIIRKGEWKLIHYYEDGREELYNLKNDLGETKNVAGENQEIAKLLSERLFSFLNEVGARFPTRDPEYCEELERKHMERVVNEIWPHWERQRLLFLSEDFDPGNNWWGSQLAK